MHYHAETSLGARSRRLFCSTHSNSTCSNALALFERLEHRTLPAGNVSVSVKDTDFGRSIVIAGTGGDDAIIVTQDSRGVVIINDGARSTRVRDRVQAIVVSGDAGDDKITFRKSVRLTAIVDAGDGDDVITGGSGRDTLLGGEGNDRISGGANNDVLDGQDGNDTLFGNAGKDLLVGGDDDDTLVALGGGAFDSLQGD